MALAHYPDSFYWQFRELCFSFSRPLRFKHTLDVDASPRELLGLFVTLHQHRKPGDALTIYCNPDTLSHAFPYLDILFTLYPILVSAPVAFSSAPVPISLAQERFSARYKYPLRYLSNRKVLEENHYSMQTILIYRLEVEVPGLPLTRFLPSHEK